jgi:CRP/FNR family transcriptional regulator
MILDDLEQLPRLDALGPDALGALTHGAVQRSYEPGAVIWLEGAEPRGVFVVLEGEVKIVRSAEGRQHVIHRAGAGATLGEVPLFADGSYPASAIAVRRTRCLVLPRERLERAIDDHPEIARLFLRHLARRVRHLVDRIDERSSIGVRARVARRLLETDRASPGEWFALGRTQEELAEELGTVREVVARALSELRESGAAESDGRGRYRVIDSRLLERVTSGR